MSPRFLQYLHWPQTPWSGSETYANKNIVQNAMNSKDHTTLVAAVKKRAAWSIRSKAKVRSRCSPLPTRRSLRYRAARLSNLLKPENLEKSWTRFSDLSRCSGSIFLVPSVDRDIKKGDGKAKLKTVQGDELTVSGSGKDLMVTDDKDTRAEG